MVSGGSHSAAEAFLLAVGKWSVHERFFTASSKTAKKAQGV